MFFSCCFLHFVYYCEGSLPIYVEARRGGIYHFVGQCVFTDKRVSCFERLISLVDRNLLYGSQLIDGASVASPSQVYLDLISLRARGEEAAEAILRGVIEPKWQ